MGQAGRGFARTDVAKLVDAALVEYLKQRGFDEPARGDEDWGRNGGRFNLVRDRSRERP